jgi:hypothetical protein
MVGLVRHLANADQPPYRAYLTRCSKRGTAADHLGDRTLGVFAEFGLTRSALVGRSGTHSVWVPEPVLIFVCWSERTHYDICLSLDRNVRKEILERNQAVDFVCSPVFIEQASAERRVESRGL